MIILLYNTIFRYCLKQFFGPLYELDDDASKEPINSILSRTQIWDSGNHFFRLFFKWFSNLFKVLHLRNLDSVYLLEDQILTQSPEVYQLLHYPGKLNVLYTFVFHSFLVQFCNLFYNFRSDSNVSSSYLSKPFRLP